MMLCLKYLVPIDCVLMLGVSVWTLFVPAYVQPYFGYGICGLCVLAAIWLIFKMVTLAKAAPDTGMPGMKRTAGLPGYQGVKQT